MARSDMSDREWNFILPVLQDKTRGLIFNVSGPQREPDVEHHRQPDDFLACIQVFERVAPLHPGSLPSPLPRSNQIALTRPVSPLLG